MNILDRIIHPKRLKIWEFWPGGFEYCEYFRTELSAENGVKTGNFAQRFFEYSLQDSLFSTSSCKLFHFLQFLFSQVRNASLEVYIQELLYKFMITVTNDNLECILFKSKPSDSLLQGAVLSLPSPPPQNF